MSHLTLYDFELEENCYRVRLILSMLGLTWTPVAIDMVPGGEHLRYPMLGLNPMGELPVLTDGDLVLTGATAIMGYLTRAYGGAAGLLPEEPAAYGQVQMWLEFTAVALRPARAARLVSMFGVPGDEAALADAARRALRILDDVMTRRQMAGSEWFVGASATLADIALFPAFALSRDYRVGHEEFPALRLWARRVRGLAGFRTMPGIPDYH